MSGDFLMSKQKTVHLNEVISVVSLLSYIDFLKTSVVKDICTRGVSNNGVSTS